MAKMNVYEIGYERGDNYYELKVMAPDPHTAIDDAKRHLEANYYSGVEVTRVKRQLKDVVYFKTVKVIKKKKTR